MASGSSLPTIWRMPDELWAILAAILAEYDPPSRIGCPRVDQRKACDGMIYRLRTGCQWNALPPEFGDDMSVYRTFRRWKQKGIFDKLMAVLLRSAMTSKASTGSGKPPMAVWAKPEAFLKRGARAVRRQKPDGPRQRSIAKANSLLLLLTDRPLKTLGTTFR